MQTSHEITVVEDDNRNASEVDNSVNKESRNYNEVKKSEKNTRRSDLSLKIPTRKVVKGVRFKEKTPRGDGESSSLLQPESPIVAKIKSIFKGNRCSSLPVKHGSNLSPSTTTPVSPRTYSEQQKSQIRSVKPPVSRSLSVPLRNIVIVRSVSFAARKDNDQIESVDDENTLAQVKSDEEIDEEEAVCRICMDTCADGNQFKMECSCKGALKLVHDGCAVKWFTMRGNKICEVCGKEVSNLPVTLFRMRSYAQRQNITAQNQQGLDPRTISAWQDIVQLVLISTICYFLLIEQLLIDELKTQATVIAAPFAFTFGLVSSTFAVKLAMKEYIWRYAVFEFALVAMLLHLFYSWIQLKAIYAVMMSSVIGFGLAMTVNELYIRWRLQIPQDHNNIVY